MAKSNKIKDIKGFLNNSKGVRIKNNYSKALDNIYEKNGELPAQNSKGYEDCDCGCKDVRQEEKSKKGFVSLYDSINKKRKIKKILGILIIIANVLLYGGGYVSTNTKSGFNIFYAIMIITFIVGVVLLITAHNDKASLGTVCPCCENDFGNEVKSEMVDAQCYVTANVDEYAREFEFDPVVNAKEYNFYLKCPSCGYSWEYKMYSTNFLELEDGKRRAKNGLTPLEKLFATDNNENLRLKLTFCRGEVEVVQGMTMAFGGERYCLLFISGRIGFVKKKESWHSDQALMN